jgi:tetratricopeptide (TPR) repeat protein
MQASVIRPEEAVRRVMPLPPQRRAQALRSMLQGHARELSRALELLPTAGAPPASPLQAAPSTSPQLRVGPYSLRSVLGEGGFGVVWMATQEEPLPRAVALKILRADRLDPAYRARFDTERHLLAMLDHPSLVKVFDAGQTDDGRPWFSMELAQGAPITEASDAARLSIDDRLRLLAQVARAVHHAHEHGLVHRDLKPSNILLAVEGDQLSVKVIDFGVAHASFLPADPDERSGALVGTPAYLAPELLRRHAAEPDVRSDVFALGLVLRRLLVDGDPEDRRESLVATLQGKPRELRRQVADERRETPGSLRRRVDGDLESIVARCVDGDPRLRYTSALELAQDIDRHLQGQAVLARGDSLAYRGLVAARRNAYALGMAALVGVVAIVAACWALQERQNALAARDSAQNTQRSLQDANAFIIDLLTEIATRPDVKSRTATELLAEASRLAGLRLATDPIQEARVRTALGHLMSRLQQHERAQQEFARAEQLLAGGNARAELDALHVAQAKALRHAGKLDEAREMATRAVTESMRAMPEDADDLALALGELARTQGASGDADAAHRTMARAYQTLQQAPGDTSPVKRELDQANADLGPIRSTAPAAPATPAPR